MGTMQRLIDGKLVLDYQSGNLNALPVLVKRWHKILCKKAFWIVKDADVAKDIAQDSWKLIMDKISNLNDPNSFGAWAQRIVYNKSIDWINQKNKERERLQAYQSQTTNNDAPEVNNPLQAHLIDEIRALPEKQQMVIKLFYVEDYSLKEIGDLLNISVGTAKSRLFHARERLKAALIKKKEY